MKKLDFKSTIVGTAIGVAVTLAIGAATEPPITVAHYGRFQATAGQNYGVILDTATGRAWVSRFDALDDSTRAFAEPKPR